MEAKQNPKHPRKEDPETGELMLGLVTKHFFQSYSERAAETIEEEGTKNLKPGSKQALAASQEHPWSMHAHNIVCVRPTTPVC